MIAIEPAAGPRPAGTPLPPAPGAGPAAPVGEAARIVSLDVLRGFAVLGILVMNIQNFSMMTAAYINPTAYGDLQGVNFWVWAGSHLLADQKFISIFSMLFGAGILLMTGRAESRGAPVARLHARRMGWLVVFGLLHAYLLWSGDILFSYGMCGLLVYLLRKQPARRLIVIGLVLMAVHSAIWLFFGWSMDYWPAEALREMRDETWQPTAPVIARELAAYRGGWLAQMPLRANESLFHQTFLFLTLYLWKAGGLMLVGMALHKLGVFAAERSRRFYLGLIGAGALIGLPLVAYGVHCNFAAGWDVRCSLFTGSQFNYWGSLAVALGWVGCVMLAFQSPRLRRLLHPLAAVGRMAFTNYLLQTVLCTTIFYGHGLGLFGRVERIGQIGIVPLVWALLLGLSPLWLSRFQFGPVEWLWRRLTYGAGVPRLARAPART